MSEHVGLSRIKSVRFRGEELEGLELLSEQRGVALNGLVRIAVRELLGLPNPSWARRLVEQHRAELELELSSSGGGKAA